VVGKPIRVLHLSPDSTGAGGIAAVVRSLLSSRLAASYRLETVATHETPVPIRRFTVFAVALMKLVRWCLGRGIRLVHVHTTVRGSLYRKATCVVVAKLLRRPVILHVHAGAGELEAFHAHMGTARRGWFRLSFETADAVVAVSTATGDVIRRCFGRADVEVVPNAAPVSAGPIVRERPALEDVDVLYLGGFSNPVKGAGVWLEAVPSVVAALPRARITLAGPGELPPAAHHLVAKGGTVRWVGWLNEQAKRGSLETADIFVLPSISEGMPMALLEAMAHGCAIVASAVGGVTDVISDGVNGMIVPPDDSERLSRAVVELGADPVLRAKLGEQARIAAEVGRDITYERLDSLYQRLVPEGA
jgi:glycosyltransferase involved in cell wall biosynthesis